MKRLISILFVSLFLLATINSCTTREVAAGTAGAAAGYIIHDRIDDDG